ncbi:MAG: tetratricopeptide repeat protein, partial [Bacteroidetes bacterium]
MGIFFLCGSKGLFAQLSPDSLYARGQALYDEGAYEESLPWLEEAAQGYLAARRWEVWTDVLSAQAGSFAGLGRYEDVAPILKAAIDTLVQHLGEDHKLVGSVCNDLGSIYASLEDCEAAMPYLQRAVAIRRKTLAPDNPSLGTTLINLSTCAEHSEGLEASNRYLEEALEIWKQAYGPDDHRLAKIYNNLGWNHGQLGLFDEQLAYYLRVVELREKGLDSLHPLLAGSYINLGIAYYWRGYYTEALAYTQKAEAVYQHNTNKNPYRLAQIYNNYAAVYDGFNDLSKARTYLWQLLDIDIIHSGKDHFYVGVSYYNLADHYAKSGEYAEALKYVQNALRIFRPLAEGEQGSYQLNLAKALTRAGEIYHALGETDAALEMIRQAEQAFSASGSTRGNIISSLSNLQAEVYEDLGQVPTARSILAEAVDFWGQNPRAAEGYLALGALELRQGRPEAAQAAFDAAAAVLTAAGQSEEDPQMLKVLAGQAEARYREGAAPSAALAEALAISQRAATLIAAWRRRGYTPEAQAQQLQEAARIYELGIHAAWALYQLDPQRSWLEQAFHLSEQGKATLLYQGLRQGDALRTGDIPQTTLEKERQLRLDRAFYQRKVYEATEADSLRLKRWRAQLFQLNRDYEALIAEIEASY